MNCLSTRKALYPSPGRCALTMDSARALEHLRECEECRRYFETHDQWSQILREKAGTESAPEPLRDRVSSQVESSQRIAMGTWFGRRSIAVGVVLAAVLSTWLAYYLPSRLFVHTLCEDHAQYIQAEPQFPSSDGSHIEWWFRDKMDFAVRVPALQNADLVGGRLCFLRGRKAALVVYRRQNRPVSLFQVSSRNVSLAALDRWVIDGAPIWHASWKGYSLAAFEQRGVVYALVSDLRESELLELASAAQVKVRGH